jgi:FkbM family methyltransferase
MFLNLRSILSYRKSFRKWFRVLYKILKHSYPFEITLKNGESYIVYGHTQIYFLLRGLTLPTYVPNDDIMLLQYKGKVLQFRDALENGAIYEIFIEESYKELEIPNSTVIDIGANIGDSSIYFALSGAKKVIAIEPQLKSYESLVSNVKLNELEDIVLSLRAGVGAKHEILSMDASKVNPSGNTSLNLKYGGEQLEVIDLHYIVDNFLSEVNSLKIDCEGCEYNFFDGASTEDLRRFEKILVEYHYGSSKIIEKLEKVGFHISLHPGMRGYNTESKPHFTSTGIIVGTLKK